MSKVNNTPNNINENIVLDQFGNINAHFYINKGRALRNKAIMGQLTALVERIKTLVKPYGTTVKNVKAA